MAFAAVAAIAIAVAWDFETEGHGAEVGNLAEEFDGRLGVVVLEFALRRLEPQPVSKRSFLTRSAPLFLTGAKLLRKGIEDHGPRWGAPRVSAMLEKARDQLEQVEEQASSLSSWGAAAGAVLGLAMAAALGWTIFRGSRNVSLPRFFAVTSVLLLFLAAGMFSTGVGKLEAMGFLPPSPTLWDTSFVLDDRGLVGGFLFGLIGYRARPSVLEAAAYAAYIVIAGWALFGGVGSKRAARPNDRLPETVA
jgi:high-affinity iron transporter